MDLEWRYEIPDNPAGIRTFPKKDGKPQPESSHRLPDVYDNPALYAAYPFLREITVDRMALPGNTIGSWNSPFNSIAVSVELENISKTLIHEIQHAIQEREGHARGASPKEFKTRRVQTERSTQLSTELAGLKAKHPGLTQAVFEYRSMLGAMDEDNSDAARISTALEEMEVDGAQRFGEDFQRALELETDLELEGIQTANNQYANVAGEIEARDASARAEMTEEQRRATPPDVRPDAIVLYGNEIVQTLTPQSGRNSAASGSQSNTFFQMSESEQDTFAEQFNAMSDKERRRIIEEAQISYQLQRPFFSPPIDIEAELKNARQESGTKAAQKRPGGAYARLKAQKKAERWNRFVYEVVRPNNATAFMVTADHYLTRKDFAGFFQMQSVEPEQSPDVQARAERVQAIQSMPAQPVTIGEHLDKKQAEAVARTFGPMENRNDGRVAELPVQAVGKIIRHKGFDVSTILPDLPGLYEGAQLGWSEEVRTGKNQPNLAGYHHYVNKFTANDGTEYYIRFAVTEAKAKVESKTPGDNLVHSTAISEVAIYKNEDASSQSLRVIDPTIHEQASSNEANYQGFVDNELQDFFDSVKPAEQENLVALHNVTSDKLMEAARLGGLPAPSLGITNAESQYDGYGEITLIGTSQMVDPASGTPVFSADTVGGITPAVAQQIGLPKAGPLLLTKSDLAAIEQKHGAQFKQAGFANGREFVAYVLSHLDAVYKPNSNTFAFVTRETRRPGQVVAELEIKQAGNSYRITTANPARKSHRKNETPLWDRSHAHPSVQTDPINAVNQGEAGQQLNLTESAGNVNLSEFAGAVVPEDANPALVKHLTDNGVTVQVYAKGENAQASQKAAATQLAKKLHAKRGDVLFQQPSKKSPTVGGLITRDPRKGTYTIHVGKAADLSSLLHEIGHFFKMEMERLVHEGLDPDGKIAEMLATIDEFTDKALVDPEAEYKRINGKSIYGAKTYEELTFEDRLDFELRAKEEYFARGFEAWLREGKAPTPQIEDAFVRFKKFLMNIYKTLTGLGVELGDDIRGVFNRMFATEQEIAEMAAFYEMIDLTESEMRRLKMTTPERVMKLRWLQWIGINNDQPEYCEIYALSIIPQRFYNLPCLNFQGIGKPEQHFQRRLGVSAF